jgi:hypothetical protein
MTARDRAVVMVVVSLVLVVGSWLMVIQPKRDQASKLGDQVKSEQAQLDSARQLVAAGEAARAAYSRNYTAVARLGEAVPPDDNVPSLIYQLQGAASAARVDFRSLALNPASGGSAGASASASQAATAALPPGAAVGPAGFPTEPFTFSFRGNFFHLADFFKRLQAFVVATNKRVAVSGRLMTLNAISLGPAPQGFPAIQAAISATTYLVPASQGLLNGATPAAPSASTGVAASTTSSSVPASPAVVSAPVR